MKINKWLEKVSHVNDLNLEGCEPSKAHFSNFDKSYIAHVGMAEDDGLLKFLAKHGVTDELTHGVGFSPSESKWYGWSHRAVFGFEVGSECKKGDCSYVGSDIDEQKEAALEFWTDIDYANVRCEGVVKKDDGRYFDIKWDYKNSTPNKKLHNTIGGVEHFITPIGRGEWAAKTLEDAKLMAIDFNEGVS